MGVIFTLDFPVLFSSLQSVGELSNFYVLCWSIGLTISLGILGHIAGHNLAHEDHRKIGLIAAGLGAALTLLVTSFRPAEQQTLSIGSYLILAFGILLSYLRAMNRDYWHLLKQRNKIQEALFEIDTQIDRIKVKNLQQQNRIRANHKAYDRTVQRQNTTYVNQFVKEIELNIGMLKAYKESVTKRINAITKKGLMSMKAARVKGLINRGHAVQWDERTMQIKVEPIVNGSSIRSFTKVLAGLFLIGLMSSCSPSSEPTNLPKSVVMIDVTGDSIDAESHDILNYLLEDHDLNQTDLMSSGMEITISAIGSLSAEATNTMTLEQGPSFLWRVEQERLEEIAVFRRNLRDHIESLMSRSNKDLPQTALMQCLCPTLQNLSTEESKMPSSILVFSDLIENKDVSFYAYKKRPKDLMKNYENLAQAFDRQCPLGRLDNINFTCVYLPTQQSDDLHSVAKAFWKRYLEERGATFVFKPNL